MIGALLPLLVQAAPMPALARPAERWEPWLSWACLVREAKRAPYALNGVIARHEDPSHPDPGLRLQRALRVLRDDSSVLAGRQARSPLFVVRRPTEFWATFPDKGGEAQAGRLLVLQFEGYGKAGTVELTTGPVTSKPYARGDCVSRLAVPKAKP